MYLLDSLVRESRAYHSQRHCVSDPEPYGSYGVENVMEVMEVSCLDFSVLRQSALFNNASSKQALLHYPSRLVPWSLATPAHHCLLVDHGLPPLPRL